jgi:hypothetical protein
VPHEDSSAALASCRWLQPDRQTSVEGAEPCGTERRKVAVMRKPCSEKTVQQQKRKALTVISHSGRNVIFLLETQVSCSRCGFHWIMEYASSSCFVTRLDIRKMVRVMQYDHYCNSTPSSLQLRPAIRPRLWRLAVCGR